MKKTLIYLFTGVVALVCGIAGYAITGGELPFVSQVEARSDTMPANPHILFLFGENNTPDSLLETNFSEHGVVQARTWEAARKIGRKRPLDAFIVDASIFANQTDADTKWLRSQLDDGVTIVGIGVSDDELAAALNIKTFQAPEELKWERGAKGYRLVQAFILALPEDLKTLKDFGWIDVQIRGSTQSPDNIKSPVQSSFSSAQGLLDTPADRALFFQRLEATIMGAYRMRAEYQHQLKQKGIR